MKIRVGLHRGALLSAVLWLGGCLSLGNQPYFQSAPIPEIRVERPSSGASSALQAAALADSVDDPAAPGQYLEAALLAWHELQTGSATPCESNTSLWVTYRSAVGRLIETVRQQGGWVPGQGLDVPTGTGRVWIPLNIQGFAWRPDEFDELIPVGEYGSPSLSRHHVADGLGAPLVVRRLAEPVDRPGNQFLQFDSYFSATAVLRPILNPDRTQGVVLELWNPQAVQSVSGPGGRVALATDYSAPFAYRDAQRAQVFDPFEMFVHPDNRPAFEGLQFLEPYQPGKIPVVFIHGLLSSPRTWIDLVNDLTSNPEFTARYQVWIFGYATGKPFVGSAAELRHDLSEAVEELSAAGHDPALHEIVLVGHSMGGLIAKLQVASSGEALWSCIADRPLDALQMSAEVREQVRPVVYFEPVPYVRRVIFVGTPHRGAALATRVVGRVGSALVRRDPDQHEKLRDVVGDNRGAFRISLRHRLPTSIDMLEPTDRMLQATLQMPLSDRVQFHTIAGNGLYTLGPGRGDGVVPVTSAVHPRAVTELQVKTTHTEIHRHPESTAEIWRILADSVEIRPVGGMESAESPDRDDVPPSPG